jgi:hypothetical protein
MPSAADTPIAIEPTTQPAPAVPLVEPREADDLGLADLNRRLRDDAAHARRLLRMSVLLLADGDVRSRGAGERFLAEAFERGRDAVDGFLARAEAAGVLGAVQLARDGTFARSPRAWLERSRREPRGP